MQTHREPINLVLYAKNIERVSAFYETILGLPRLESENEFVCIGGLDFQIIVVQAPKQLVEHLHISTPPVLRSETPLKHSFLVDDLERASAAAASTGGGAKPISEAWSWRGQLHLDGYDPEGNIVQFRVHNPESSNV